MRVLTYLQCIHNITLNENAADTPPVAKHPTKHRGTHKLTSQSVESLKFFQSRSSQLYLKVLTHAAAASGASRCVVVALR